MTMTTGKRAPEDTARVIAKNPTPDFTQALEPIRLLWPVEVWDVQDGRGTVLITLR